MLCDILCKDTKNNPNMCSQPVTIRNLHTIYRIIYRIIFAQCNFIQRFTIQQSKELHLLRQELSVFIKKKRREKTHALWTVYTIIYKYIYLYIIVYTVLRSDNFLSPFFSCLHDTPAAISGRNFHLLCKWTVRLPMQTEFAYMMICIYGYGDTDIQADMRLCSVIIFRCFCICSLTD
jgi:hypothetical protein